VALVTAAGLGLHRVPHVAPISLADRQADLQRDIESAKDMFERAKSFNTLTRDRIISGFDGALNAYGVLSTYAQLVGRPAWVGKHGAAAIEDRVQSEASALRERPGVPQVHAGDA
jgi:hypothetical protein